MQSEHRIPMYSKPSSLDAHVTAKLILSPAPFNLFEAVLIAPFEYVQYHTARGRALMAIDGLSRRRHTSS